MSGFHHPTSAPQQPQFALSKTTAGGFGRSTSTRAASGYQQQQQVQKGSRMPLSQAPNQTSSAFAASTNAPQQPQFAPVTTAGGFGRSTSVSSSQQQKQPSQEVPRLPPRQTPSQQSSSTFAASTSAPQQPQFAPVKTTAGGFGRSTSVSSSQQPKQSVQEVPRLHPRQTPSQQSSSAFNTLSNAPPPQPQFAPVTTASGFGQSTSIHIMSGSQHQQQVHAPPRQSPSQRISPHEHTVTARIIPTDDEDGRPFVRQEDGAPSIMQRCPSPFRRPPPPPPRQRRSPQHHSVVRRLFPLYQSFHHHPSIVQRHVSFAPETSQNLRELLDQTDRAHDEMYAKKCQSRVARRASIAMKSEGEEQLLAIAKALHGLGDLLQAIIAQNRAAARNHR